MSNSTCHGLTYLEHCLDDIANFLDNTVSRILFVPFAFVPEQGREQEACDTYAEKPRGAFAKIGIAVDPLHRYPDPRAAVQRAQAIFIGGGNTHYLLSRLYSLNLIDAIKEKVAAGCPVMGASAGTIVLCPTIKTTNDMPIVHVPDFTAIRAVPFQINAHYLDPDTNSTHQGETRQERIQEFLRLNDVPVLGLREGAWLRIEGNSMTLKGATGARLFRRADVPVEHKSGADLSFLID
ncbi:MAG: dipeptidase PepE [Blastocatellia bacterium]